MAACAGASAGSPAASRGSSAVTAAGSAGSSAWHRATVAGATGGQVSDLSVTDTGFAAVGDLGYAGPGVGWTSADGESWQANAGAAALATTPVCLVFQATKSLAAFGPSCSGGGESTLGTEFSFDGTTWTSVGDFVSRTDDLPHGTPHDVARFASAFVAVGSEQTSTSPVTWTGHVWTSPDGLAWVESPVGQLFAGSIVDGVAAGPQGLVAVGASGGEGDNAAFWSSTDGKAWTRAANPADAAGANAFAVAVGGPGFVAVGRRGTDAAVWTSTDGQTWTGISSDTFKGGQMLAIASGPSEVVAVGYGPDGAVVWTSTDGSSWTRLSGGVFAGARAATVVAKGDRFLVGGSAATGSPAEAIVWVGR